ncbi:15851_t:CDS:2 [Gigaspora margarita]|uniref:15851_t:CDS:1 n=1 Tax=Gigaspora margarita TaxID=4874 RepID=A0ABN7VLS1_GIGMA|nr:15851_t:CDS:2 [Gigaspora margarita]
METDTGPDMVTDSEQIDIDYQQSLSQKRVKIIPPEPSISQSNIEIQINIDENSVSGKSSKTPTIFNNIMSPTEHNTTDNLIQGTEIYNKEPITTSTTEKRKNRTRATLNDNVFFDISDVPVFNLESCYITEKMETESNTITEDDTPENKKQRSYSEAVTGTWKGDSEWEEIVKEKNERNEDIRNQRRIR